MLVDEECDANGILQDDIMGGGAQALLLTPSAAQ